MLAARVLGFLIMLQLSMTVSSHSATALSRLSDLWATKAPQLFESMQLSSEKKEPQSRPVAFLRQAVRDRFQIPPSWQPHLDWVRGEPIVHQLHVVNVLVNKTPYVEDPDDQWKLPKEFLINGGDCEEFAIAKYVLLRAMGYSPGTLRIAIVKMWGNSKLHALLVVKGGPGRFETYVLDNLAGAVRTAVYAKSYWPLLSFNEYGVWTHVKVPSLGARILRYFLTRGALEPGGVSFNVETGMQPVGGLQGHGAVLTGRPEFLV